MKNNNRALMVKNQEGQVFVLFIVLVPLLLFVLFATANLTFLIRDRMRLQNSADAAALSAAGWEAHGLNQMAMVNACIEAGDLLKRSYKPGNAQIRMIEAEQRSFNAARDEIARSIPAFAAKAARENGMATLLATPNPGNSQAMTGPLGVAICGSQGPWRYQLSDAQFNENANRIIAVSWRRKQLAGAVQTVFNKFHVGPGYAFASARAHSPSLASVKTLLVPDFAPEIAPVALTSRAYAYMKDNLQLHFIQESEDEINGSILH